MEPQGAESFVYGVMSATASALLPVLGTLFGIALLGGILQGRPMISWSRVKPKWSKLNPASGAKRMFGKMALMEVRQDARQALRLVGGVAAYLAWPHAATVDLHGGRGPAASGRRDARHRLFDAPPDRDAGGRARPVRLCLATPRLPQADAHEPSGESRTSTSRARAIRTSRPRFARSRCSARAAG